jgi:hypothetical protein
MTATQVDAIIREMVSPNCDPAKGIVACGAAAESRQFAILAAQVAASILTGVKADDMYRSLLVIFATGYQCGRADAETEALERMAL